MYQDSNTILLLCVAAAYPVAAQNPYTTAPRNYRLEFENESVRVSRAMFSPGDTLSVHNHPGNPTVFVYLTDGGRIRFTHVEPGFTVERAAVKQGAIRYHTGAKETHIVEYMGNAPSEYLRIELKTERPEKGTQHIRIAAEDLKPFENGQIRISRSECPAMHHCAVTNYPTLVVTLNDRSASWYDGGSAIENAKGEASHQIWVELKTRPRPGAQ